MSSKIHVVFGSISKTENIENYIQAKICKPKSENYSDIEEEVQTLEVHKMAQQLTKTLTSLSEPEIATLNNIPNAIDIQKKLQDDIDCFIRETDAILPLAANEKILPNGKTVSFLLKDWKGYKQGTPFVKRVTNISVLYFFRPDLKMEEGQLLDISRPDAEMPSHLLNFPLQTGAGLSADADWTAGIKVLVDGLMGMAPPPFDLLGAALLAMVWPNGSSTNWEIIYESIRQIIIEELDKQTLTNTYAELRGVLDYVSSEYVHLAEDPKTPKETLQEKLEFYNHTLYTKILSIFQDDRYANASLGNFLVAASAHLALFQERALQDPNHQGNPLNSPYTKTLIQKAQEYANHVDKVIPKIAAARVTKISGLKVDQKCTASSIGDLICSYSYYYTDQKTGKNSELIGREPGEKALEKKWKAKADKHRTDYITSVRNSTTAALQMTAGTVAKKWRELANNPIPVLTS